MRNHQYVLTVLCFAVFCAAPSLLFSQDSTQVNMPSAVNIDPLSTKIMGILPLLKDEEKRDIVVIARSQRKIKPEEELVWLLASLDEEQKGRVLKFLKSKAGSRLKAEDTVAEIYWLEDLYKFGYIREGKVIKHVFEFENIGKVPYIIENVEGSCGCTIPSYTRAPILPGEKGKIVVTFNSKGKVGDNTEFITIKGNTHPASVSLMIEGHVYR